MVAGNHEDGGEQIKLGCSLNWHGRIRRVNYEVQGWQEKDGYADGNLTATWSMDPWSLWSLASNNVVIEEGEHGALDSEGVLDRVFSG